MVGSHRSRDRWYYVLLAEELRRVCAEPDKQAQELFRRMWFNALISNIDDHPRNHAVIAKDRGWKLSPAYDLTPSTPISLERRDFCGDQGRLASAENLLAQCSRFRLKRAEARAILQEMEACVAQTWLSVAWSEGVMEQDCHLIQGAFVYPRLRLQR